MDAKEIFPPSRGTFGLGAAEPKMTVPQVAQLATKFIKVSPADVKKAVEVIETAHAAIDVTGKTWKQVVADEEARYGFKLVPDQVAIIKKRYPATGFRGVISSNQRGSINTVRGFLSQTKRFLEAL